MSKHSYANPLLDTTLKLSDYHIYVYKLWPNYRRLVSLCMHYSQQIVDYSFPHAGEPSDAFLIPMRPHIAHHGSDIVETGHGSAPSL